MLHFWLLLVSLSTAFGNLSSSIDLLNRNISTTLHTLTTSRFFRYYKINLYRSCPFWKENSYCFEKDCTVETVENESEIPQEWKAAQLSAVEFSSLKSNGFELMEKKCQFKDQDFCLLEEESSNDGVYVNLLKNPERFTGYSGESAARIWRAIYEENCFAFLKDEALFKGSFTGNQKNVCIEKQSFYRLISGLHSSISTHICNQHFDRKNGIWFADVNCFQWRVGNHPDRIQNMYFVYGIMAKALKKASNYLAKYPICSGSVNETSQVKHELQTVLSSIQSAEIPMNISRLFQSGHFLKDQFKEHFRNVSRIMDCVSCQKCRLWGKLQTSGIGTALKILFSYEEKTKDFKLTRGEVVALLNAFDRLSLSLDAKTRFEKMFEAQKRFNASIQGDFVEWVNETLGFKGQRVALNLVLFIMVIGIGMSVIVKPKKD